jgi:hypothetical protein
MEATLQERSRVRMAVSAGWPDSSAGWQKLQVRPAVHAQSDAAQNALEALLAGALRCVEHGFFGCLNGAGKLLPCPREPFGMRLNGLDWPCACR